MKAVIVARVSTEEQKEAGNSLPAQIARLERYCNGKGFDIFKKFSFDESAYKNLREDFDEILDFVLKQKEVIAVCFDKVDRLSRNVFDKRVSLLYEKAIRDEIELHFVSDNQIVNSKISAVEKFQFGISLGLAKYYSDAISDNVKRATEQMLRKGEWTTKAPIGYLNIELDENKKWIEPDAERADLVIKLFEWYATAIYSMEMLRRKAASEGLTNNTKLGKPLTKSQVAHILQNPFYYGEMKHKGKLYPHKYKPLISKELFDKVQEVKQNWHKKPFAYAGKFFLYRGLLCCANCGLRITFELKKGRYIYGHCTNFYGNCPNNIWVREEDINEQVEMLLKDLSISQEVLEELVKELRENHKAKSEYHERTMDNLKTDYDRMENRIDKMYEDLLDGSITQEKYDTLLEKYKRIQADVLIQMEEHSNADESYHIEAGKLLELAQKAYKLFEISEAKQKRELLSYLLQNSKMDGKKLIPSLKMPFDAILTANKTKDWLGDRDSNSDRQIQNLQSYH